MQIYKVKIKRFGGRNYGSVYDQAMEVYKQIKKRTKRRPYIRSAYFKKDKIFLGLFWSHLDDKNWRDRFRRLKFFSAAIDLIRHCPFDPNTRENPNKKSELFHTFSGKTSDGFVFTVQIKEDKKTGQKWFLSTFPE